MPVITIIAFEGTGVQRAARDVAIGLSIPVAGLSRQEDGSSNFDRIFAAQKSSAREAVRRNVIASDATLVLFDTAGIACSAGAMFAQQCAADCCRPTMVVHIGDYLSLERARTWLASLPAALTLHIAGPRSDEAPGIYESAYYFLEELLDRSHPSTRTAKIEDRE